MRFVDTNVLIYAAAPPALEPEKRRRARELLLAPDLAFSVQVLQEFYFQATRQTRPGRLTHDQAMQFLAPLLRLPVQDMTVDLFATAVAISHRCGISYWDDPILAAARALRCDAVYSKDLRSEQDYDGVRVIDPSLQLSRIKPSPDKTRQPAMYSCIIVNESDPRKPCNTQPTPNHLSHRQSSH